VITARLQHASPRVSRRVFHGFFTKNGTISSKSSKRWWARQGLNL
jgi:hypothetical protein